MGKNKICSVSVDFDARYQSCIGHVTFWRKDGEELDLNSYRLQLRNVARALEAQRLMLAKIEAQKVVSNE